VFIYVQTGGVGGGRRGWVQKPQTEIRRQKCIKYHIYIKMKWLKKIA